MNGKKLINVLIKPDGSIEIAPSGFKGKACLKVTKFLEDSLGLDPDKSKPTREMYQAETEQGEYTTEETTNESSNQTNR